MISEKKEKQLIKKIDKKRNVYMNEKRYGQDICDLFLQNFNFKGNRMRRTEVQKEIFPLLKQVIESYPEEFPYRNVDLIKDSLSRSFYASQNTTLLSHYIEKLINNDRDSFLIIPTGFRTGTSRTHEVSCTIRKSYDDIQVEVFDKAHKVPPEREKIELKIRGSHNKNYIVANYIYTIDNTPESINSITAAIESGFKPSASDRKYKVLNSLSEIAKSEYYGGKVTSAQYTQGNCLIKEVISSLKHVLSEGNLNAFATDKQRPTASLNAILTEVACQRLEKIGYGKDINNYLRDQYKLYNYLKEERKKIPENSVVKRKIEDAKMLSNNFHDAKIPEFKKVITHRLETSLMNSDPKKGFFSRFKKFMKIERTKVQINSLTDREIQMIRSNVDNVRKTLESEREKTGERFQRMKDKAISMSTFSDPNLVTRNTKDFSRSSK